MIVLVICAFVIWFFWPTEPRTAKLPQNLFGDNGWVWIILLAVAAVVFLLTFVGLFLAGGCGGWEARAMAC